MEWQDAAYEKADTQSFEAFKQAVSHQALAIGVAA